MKFKPLISKIRGSNNESLDSWFKLDRPRVSNIFTQPKIVAPQRSKSNTFGYNEINWHASADVYYIIEKDETLKLKYVLALLNSKLYYKWLYYKGKRKGEMLELYQKPLSEIPIKKAEIEIQKTFEKKIDEILKIKGGNPDQDVTVIANDIDNMVYELYGLSEEEIKIVEES